MLEKDTNSGLNTFAYRHQQVMIANLYRQDFIKPGYTIQASFHYDKDDPSFAVRHQQFPGAPGAHRIGDAAFDSRLLLRPDRRRAFRQDQRHARLLSGAGAPTSSTRSPDSRVNINAQMARRGTVAR